MKHSARARKLLEGFGRRLRAAREVAGYGTREDISADLGIEAPRYRKYERGESLPHIDVLEDIVTLLDIDAGWLLFGHNTRKTRQRPDAE